MVGTREQATGTRGRKTGTEGKAEDRSPRRLPDTGAKSSSHSRPQGDGGVAEGKGRRCLAKHPLTSVRKIYLLSS